MDAMSAVRSAGRGVLLRGLGVAALLGVLLLPSGAEAGGGAACHEELTTGSGTRVDIQRGCYTPTVLHVNVGDEVTWTNHDQAPHTVSGVQQSWGNYEQFGLDEEMSFRFDEPGTYLYLCALHPFMQGAVVVGDGVAPDTGLDASMVAATGADAAGEPAGNARATALAASALAGLLVGAVGMTGLFTLRQR